MRKFTQQKINKPNNISDNNKLLKLTTFPVDISVPVFGIWRKHMLWSIHKHEKFQDMEDL